MAEARRALARARAKDETQHVDLQPRGDATLRGTIQFDGELPDVARVIVSSQAEPPFLSPGDSRVGYSGRGRATFAENGRFEISNLDAGPHGIGVYFELSDGSLASGGTAFEMAASGVLELVVPVKKR